MPQIAEQFGLRRLRVGAARSVSMLVLVLAGLGADLGLVGSANAQPAAAPAAQGGEPARRFASVWRLRGDINATAGGSATARRLQPGDVVYVGERISAESTSEVVLRTDDAGLIAVRPGGTFMAERFVADGQSNDQVTLRIFAGALRMITGWVGRTNRADYRILTPTATVGIRGTDHEPYVMTAELATILSQPAGTYNKVNRGGTTLEASGRRLDIDPGKVGFVRAASGSATRALMTILLPVLLDRVPEFYVPGQFDAELDQLSAQADEDAMRQLEERRRSAPAAPATAAPASPATAPAAASEAAPAAAPGGTQSAACGANDVAKSWLAQLDSAIARRNASAIVRLFAPQATIQANVRGSDGALTTLEISRDEFVQSTLAAVKGLTEFSQRRPAIEGLPAEPGSCARIIVRSVVIEQGRQNGTPYRFESVEEYLLERRAGRWLAIKASTTQR